MIRCLVPVAFLCLLGGWSAQPADAPVQGDSAKPLDFKLVGWKPGEGPLVGISVASPSEYVEFTPFVAELCLTRYEPRGEEGLALVKMVKGAGLARSFAARDGTILFHFSVPPSSTYFLSCSNRSNPSRLDGPYEINFRLPPSAVKALFRCLPDFQAVEKECRNFIDAVEAAVDAGPVSRKQWHHFFVITTRLSGFCHRMRAKSPLSATGFHMETTFVGIRDSISSKIGRGSPNEGATEGMSGGYDPDGWRARLDRARRYASREMMLGLLRPVSFLLQEVESVPCRPGEIMEDVKGYREAYSELETGCLASDLEKYSLHARTRFLLDGLQEFLTTAPPEEVLPVRRGTPGTEKPEKKKKEKTTEEEVPEDDATDEGPVPECIEEFREAFDELLKQVETSSH